MSNAALALEREAVQPGRILRGRRITPTHISTWLVSLCLLAYLLAPNRLFHDGVAGRLGVSSKDRLFLACRFCCPLGFSSVNVAVLPKLDDWLWKGDSLKLGVERPFRLKSNPDVVSLLGHIFQRSALTVYLLPCSLCWATFQRIQSCRGGPHWRR